MPVGVSKQRQHLANQSGLLFRGHIRGNSSTTIGFFDNNNVIRGSSIAHGVSILTLIKTAKLPNSNNQIVVASGSSGRRVWHLNPVTNTWTQIYTSTAITTGVDICMDSTAGKFYIVFISSSGTTSIRVRMIIGTISNPTATISTDTGLTDPGAAAYTVAWNPQGTLLAVRTQNTIRTYTRSGDTVSLFATSYSLSGGQTGTGFEDISWNSTGTVLAASDRTTTNIIRYSVASGGALTSIGTTALTESDTLPMFNPNTNFDGVLALPNNDVQRLRLAYYTSASGSLVGAVTSPISMGLALVIQGRWSPTGDKFAAINDGEVEVYNFIGINSTITRAFTLLASYATSSSGFDFVYY